MKVGPLAFPRHDLTIPRLCWLLGPQRRPQHQSSSIVQLTLLALREHYQLVVPSARRSFW